jgi:hypothetical protein
MDVLKLDILSEVGILLNILIGGCGEGIRDDD